MNISNKVQNPIPAQNKGAQSDVSQQVSCVDAAQAGDLFRIAKDRLLHVSDWKEISEGFSSEFQLTDTQGNTLDRPAREGDFFQIDIPAPGSSSGDGYDWVQIEEIKEQKDLSNDVEIISMRVRPAKNPLAADGDTAHFFKDDATSTFLVKRHGSEVSAEVHGRNEVPNTESEGLADKIRNTVIGIGAALGFSKPQWTHLVKGLLK